MVQIKKSGTPQYTNENYLFNRKKEKWESETEENLYKKFIWLVYRDMSYGRTPDEMRELG